MSPHVGGFSRRKRRETAMMKRRSSLFASGGSLLAPLPALHASQETSSPVTSLQPLDSHPRSTDAVRAPPAGGGAAPGLLVAIQDFNKDSRLKKVRRQSRAFAARPSLRRSISGERKSIGAPPPPPPLDCDSDVADDIASVLARAIMRRRTESRLFEDDHDDEKTTDSDGAWGISP